MTKPRLGAFVLALSLVAAVGAEPAGAQPTKPAPVKPSSTSTLLDRAQSMFDDQRYEESIQTLSGALVRPGNTTDEKSGVLKLLAFNYIAMGRTEEADAAVRALYVNDENYELPKGESPRFRDFFKKTKDTWVSEGKPGKTQGASTGPAPEASIKITHSPPAQADAGSTVKIEGKIDDPDARVEKVELAVKAGSKGKFQEKPLIYSMGAFRGEIQATSVQPPLVEYYILALDKDGLPLASRGDVDAPLRIAVPESGKAWYVHPAFWVPVSIAVVAGAVLTGVLVATQGSSSSTVKVSVGE